MRLNLRRWAGLMPFLAALGSAAAQPPLAGERHALLVACGRSGTPGLAPLLYSKTDITAFGDVLKAGSYRVAVLHDDPPGDAPPTTERIRAQLRRVLDGRKPDDTVVVAFAGQGVQFPGDAMGHICPTGANLANRATLLALDDVYAQMQSCPASQKLLLVQANRVNPGGARAGRPVVVPQPAKPGTGSIAALFGCSAGQRCFGSDQLKRGVFFHFLIEAWKGAAADREGRVTILDLASYADGRTSSFVRAQFNEVQSPEFVSQVRGQWVLNTIRPADGK